MEDPLWSIFGPNAPIFSTDIHSVSSSGATSGFLLSPLSDSPETPNDNNENLFPFDPVVSQSLIPGWVHESLADVLPEKLKDMTPISDASLYGTSLDHQILVQQQQQQQQQQQSQQQQQFVASHKYQQNNVTLADVSTASKPIQQAPAQQQQHSTNHHIMTPTSQPQFQQRQLHMPLQLDQYQISSASALGIVTPDGTIGPELLSAAQFESLASSDMSALALSPSLAGGPVVTPKPKPVITREPASPSESVDDMSDEEKRSGSKRKQSESRMPLPELYARMGLAHNHEEARKREQRILKVLQDQGFELAHKTWVRDTKEHERTKIISEIHNQTYADYGYDKELIEIIVRRGSYYLMQGRLRRIRRNSRRMELKRQKGLI